MKNTVKILFSIIILLISSSFSLISQLPIYLDDTKSLDERVADALKRLTLQEKVELCSAQSLFTSPGVPRLGIPELHMSDGPHGIRQEQKWDEWGDAGFTNDSSTAFPALTCLAATWNPALSYQYGNAIGEEARYRNKEILLGPGVNIYRTPLNGRNFEYLGEDPYLASKMVVPYIQGVQSNGVSACVKHFALNNQEDHRMNIEVKVSDRALNEIYLPAFKAAVTEGKVWAVMGAYNKFRGQFACQNEYLLNKILKNNWAFDGVVISDWGGAHGTKECALNGLDIEMGTSTNGLTESRKNSFSSYYLANPYLKLLESGELPITSLDNKARRILKLIFRTSLNRQRPYGSFITDEHYLVAQRIAEEGIVLLKNESQLLPINFNQNIKIAVIGENAIRQLTKGGGSSELKVKKEISPLQALENRFGTAKIKFSLGYASGNPEYGKAIQPKFNIDSLKRAAVQLAKNVDIVIFFGGLNKNYQQDCEGGDRVTYNLPFGQNELISELVSANKNTIVVITSGNAVAMPWVNQVPSIIQSWYLGSMAGIALTNIISGEINPSGKLPFSYPIRLSDCGAHSFGQKAYPGENNIVEYTEDLLVGYRWFDTKKIKPLFSFGHGLSYTSFKYGKVELDRNKLSGDDKILVSIPIKNTGKLIGSETVQLYIADRDCSVLRPLKELKSFCKINLKPNEEKVVTFEINIQMLKFFDDITNSWILEKGKFGIYIGTSSSDIKSISEFEYQ